jgi:HEAT repeat protein
MAHPRKFPLISSSSRPRSVFLALLLVFGFAPAVRAADPLPEDPVEAFREDLSREKDLRNSQIEALRYRERTLTRDASKIRTLSDLSRALLLFDWPVRSNDPTLAMEETAVRDIETKVRKDLSDRFVKGVTEVIDRGSDAEKAAVSSLVAETVAGAGAFGDERLALYESMNTLAPELEKLARSGSPLVRQAAAKALGEFPSRAKAVIPALSGVLNDRRAEPGTRLAAASALSNLVRVASGREAPEMPLEPGVRTVRLALQRAQPTALRVDPFPVCAEVIPVAARGLQDPSPAVRRASAEVLHEVTLTLIASIPKVDPEKPEVTGLAGAPYPPPGRPWTPGERRRVAQGRADVDRINTNIGPMLRAFALQAEVLKKAAVDPDAQVRIRIRRVLENLAIARTLLQRLDEFVPPLPGKKPLDFGRGEPRRPAHPALLRPIAAVARARSRRPAVTLGGPVVPGQPRRLPAGWHRGEARSPSTGVALGAPRKSSKVRRVGLGVPRALPVLRQAEEGGVEKENTGRLLKVLEAGEAAMTAKGLTDPSARSRLNAVETLENMGLQGAPAIPALIGALSDPNPYVRWASARTLGRLAEREDEARKEKKVPKELEGPLKRLADAIPDLARLLCDPNQGVRMAVATAMRRFGPRAAPAVPALREVVGSSFDVEYRVAVMKALQRVGIAAVPALPALVPALKDPDPRVREEAARVLGRFGRHARFALPALRGALDDPDNMVRKAVSEAILNIGGIE